MTLWGVFFFSGVAALGFQVVWSKMLALSLGHEFRAVVTVVSAFFGGMALGGALSGKLLASPRGRFAVPILELLIGTWALLSPRLFHAANNSWLFRFGPLGSALVVFLLLLPATTAMGATLPAMASLAARNGSARATRNAYAGNTFGGVLGCLLAAYVLMPLFSLPACLRLFALGNLISAALARSLSEGTISFVAKKIKPSIAATIFVTGFIALGFETLGVRFLSQSLEDTVYTFASILAIYLCGQALGAALFRRWRPKSWILFLRLGISIGLSWWLFGLSPEMYDALRKRFGDSVNAVAFAEGLVTLAVIALPTIWMGAVFAELAERATEPALGAALFWNSMGAGLGAVIVPMVVLTQVGGFLARAPAGHKIIEQRTGALASVMVTETPDGNHTLFVNNRFQMGGTSAAIPELRQGHIPLLLATRRERALFLGVGTGISLSAAQAYEGLQAEGVELLPEVVEVIPQFTKLSGTNIQIHVGDARRFIRQTTNVYDVVIGELFHPAQDGAGFLYTAEHFRRIKERLSDYGLFCQWLPLHQLDLETFRIIASTFVSVFPEAELYLLRFNIDAPVVGLVGWNRKEDPKLDVIEGLATDPKLGPELRRVALGDSIRLMGCLLANDEQLGRFVAGARINTDDHPIVIFEAPRFSYLRNAPSYQRLVAVMDAIGQRPANTFPSERHYRFAQARDVYLRALVLEAKGDSEHALDGYIESARMSEDFTSGYAQCLAIATAQSKTKPEAAKQILKRLIEVQPDRPVAKQMLERLER